MAKLLIVYYESTGCPPPQPTTNPAPTILSFTVQPGGTSVVIVWDHPATCLVTGSIGDLTETPSRGDPISHGLGVATAGDGTLTWTVPLVTGGNVQSGNACTVVISADVANWPPGPNNVQQTPIVTNNA